MLIGDKEAEIHKEMAQKAIKGDEAIGYPSYDELAHALQSECDTREAVIAEIEKIQEDAYGKMNDEEYSYERADGIHATCQVILDWLCNPKED